MIRRRPTRWTGLVTATTLLLGTALPAPVAAAPAGPAPAAPGTPVAASGTAPASPDPIAHDPTIIKQGRYYYEFITGDIGTRTYLPVRRSTDLVHWTLLGTVMRTSPEWVVQELGITPGDFWAPDINYFDGEYHLYYAASSFGTNNSVIGLATNATLDPDSPDYRWVDRGTGLLSPADSTLYSLASRGGAAIEGPSIVRKGRYYYLFASFDFCCRGVNSDYRVVVGRSTSVHGPYLDRAGVPMLAGGGTELLRGYNGFRGTGGGDVHLGSGRGRSTADLYVHHYYDVADQALPKGSVRTISWAGGWPTLSEPPSGNRGFGRGDAYVTVVGRDSGAVLTNRNCGYEGAEIGLADPVPGDACQQWRLEDRGNGYASILNRHSNKVAEVAACVNADGARVAQWGWLDNDCQKFRVLATDKGWSRIENRIVGRVLDGCARPGAAVQTYTWRGDACQQFRLQPVGEVLIADVANRRLLGGSRWRFDHVAEGYYRIVNQRTGRALAATDRPGPGAQWRIEPTNTGTYRLVTRDGGAVRDVLLLTP